MSNIHDRLATLLLVGNLDTYPEDSLTIEEINTICNLVGRHLDDYGNENDTDADHRENCVRCNCLVWPNYFDNITQLCGYCLSTEERWLYSIVLLSAAELAWAEYLDWLDFHDRLLNADCIDNCRLC